MVDFRNLPGSGLFKFCTFKGFLDQNLEYSKGKQTFEDGTIYEGSYEYNKFHGPGYLALVNG